MLRESGLTDDHAEALYDRVVDPASWTPYPDTAAVLTGCAGGHQDRGGVQHRVRRPACVRRLGVADDVDEFVLSFEVGAVKPDRGDLRDRADAAGRRGRGRADGR